jgi:hypothetical protein
MPFGKPNSITHNQPNSITHNQPYSIAHNQPNNITHNQPNNITHNQLYNITHNQPYNVTHDQPYNITHNQPNSITRNQLYNITHNQPNSITHNQPNNITQNQPFIEIQVLQGEGAKGKEEAGSERDGVTNSRIVDCDDDRGCSRGGNLRRSCRRHRRDQEAAGCDGSLARAALQRREGGDGCHANSQRRHPTDERRVQRRRPMGLGAQRVMLFLVGDDSNTPQRALCEIRIDVITTAFAKASRQTQGHTPRQAMCVRVFVRAR